MCAPKRRGVEEEMPDKVYEIPADWAKRAFIDRAKYRAMYDRSLADPNGFWAEQAKRIHWFKAFTEVKEHLVRSASRFDQVVRGRHHQRGL